MKIDNLEIKNFFISQGEEVSAVNSIEFEHFIEVSANEIYFRLLEMWNEYRLNLSETSLTVKADTH